MKLSSIHNCQIENVQESRKYHIIIEWNGMVVSSKQTHKQKITVHATPRFGVELAISQCLAFRILEMFGTFFSGET